MNRVEAASQGSEGSDLTLDGSATFGTSSDDAAVLRQAQIESQNEND